MSEPPEPSLRDARAFRVGVALVLVLALGLRLLGVDDPWTTAPSYRGLFGGYALGGPASDFADHGVWESGGLPYRWRLRYADGSVHHELYKHHPALWFWVSGWSLAAFGLHEWALRLPALLFSLFAVGATIALCARLFDRRLALVAGIVVAVVPFGARDGIQPCTEGPLVGLLAMAVFEYVGWLRSGSRAALVRSALWVLGAALLDWPAHLLLPGLVAHAWWHRRRDPVRVRLAPLGAYAAASLTAILLHAAHTTLLSGAEHVSGDLRATLASRMRMPAGVAYADFAAIQGRAFLANVGRVFAALCALGALVLLAARHRRDPARSALWPLLLPGLGYVVLFPTWSTTHHYFQMLALPWIAGCAALGARAIGVTVRRFAPRAATPLVALVVALGALESGRESVQQWRRLRSAEIAELVSEPWLAPLLADPDAVVLTHQGRGMLLPFYARAPVITQVNGAALLQQHLADDLARVEPGRRAVFVLDEQYGQLLPDYGALEQLLSSVASASARHVARRGSYRLYELPTGAR